MKITSGLEDTLAAVTLGIWKWNYRCHVCVVVAHRIGTSILCGVFVDEIDSIKTTVVNFLWKGIDII